VREYFLVWAVSSWYGKGEIEKGELALMIVLDMLGFSLGTFVGGWAYHGFTKAFGNTFTPDAPW